MVVTSLVLVLRFTIEDVLYDTAGDGGRLGDPSEGGQPRSRPGFHHVGVDDRTRRGDPRTAGTEHAPGCRVS